MSTNNSDLFVFVKGNLGRCAYLISDNNFNELYKTIEDDIHTIKGKPSPPAHTDYEAIIKSLEYIEEHRGVDNIPPNPVVFIYSNFENTYHLCSTLKNPNPAKTHMVEYVSKIKELMSDLKRSDKDDNVKFLFVPKKFTNKMDVVDQILATSKQTPSISGSFK